MAKVILNRTEGQVASGINKIINTTERNRLQLFIKRIIDFTLSLIGFIILSPFMFLIILLIRLGSPGEAIYKQTRIGYKQKEFCMYKFRTMTMDADQKIKDLQDKNETNPVMFKIQNDPRITKIGKFLRKYSLDELPQLINVILGEMSLIGPRPPLPSELEKYQDWHYLRFLAKPGLTGLWQVSGRSKIKDFDQVLALDFHYIREWNLILDLYILLKTIPVVILGRE